MSEKYEFIELYPVDKDGRRKIPVDVFNGEAADKFEDGKGYFLLFGLGVF